MGTILWFLVALLTIQGSFTSPRNEMDDLLGEFLEAQNEASQIISFIDIHLSSILQNFEKKIYEASHNKEVTSILQELKDLIQNFKSKDDAKQCKDNAFELLLTTTNEVKKEVTGCANIAQTAERRLQDVLETLNAKATNLKARVITEMHTCLVQGEDISDENVKCLQDIIVVLKEELTEIEKEKKDAHYVIHEASEQEEDKLNKCMQRVKEDLKLKYKKIIEQLEECLQDTSFSSSTKQQQRGILDFFKELKQKINTIIEFISNLPTSVDQIPEKIHEMISHINIIAIINQLKSEINQLISEGGRDAEKCRPAAEKQLIDIKTNSESKIKICVEDAHGKVDRLKTEISDLVSNLFNEAKLLLANINNLLISCYWENMLNPIQYFKCLQSQYGELKQNITMLQNNVTSNYDMVKNQADIILKDLATCANKIQVNTVQEGQTLIKEVEKCIWTTA